MTKWKEWDFDFPGHHNAHRSRVETAEILPPRQPEHDVRITVRRRRDPIVWCVVAAIAFVGLLLWRSPLAVLMLGAMVGWTNILTAMALAVLLVAVAAWREWRHGRPF